MRALLRIGPYAVLAAAGAWVAIRWDRLPARYPVHWGVGGADRFVDLSPRAVAVPLLLGALVVSWMAWMRRFVLANSAPAPDPSRARRLAATTTAASEWLLALVFAAAAVPKQGPGLVFLAAGAGLSLLPAALVATYAGKARPEPDVPAPPGGWLLVQRADGTGLRFAPGHPGIRSAVVRFLAFPVALVLVALVA